MKNCLGVLVGILMMMVFAVNSVWAAEVLLLNYTWTNNYGYTTTVAWVGATDISKVAQSVKSDVTLNNVSKIVLRAEVPVYSPPALPEGDYKVSIQTSTIPTGGGEPSGTILVSTIVSKNNIPALYSKIDTSFVFSSTVTLQANIEYWILALCTSKKFQCDKRSIGIARPDYWKVGLHRFL